MQGSVVQDMLILTECLFMFILKSELPLLEGVMQRL
jgi:hypothetical protein